MQLRPQRWGSNTHAVHTCRHSIGAERGQRLGRNVGGGGGRGFMVNMAGYEGGVGMGQRKGVQETAPYTVSETARQTASLPHGPGPHGLLCLPSIFNNLHSVCLCPCSVFHCLIALLVYLLFSCQNHDHYFPFTNAFIFQILLIHPLFVCALNLVSGHLVNKN